MAIAQHTIRWKGGEKTIRNLTAIKAVRFACLECTGWSPAGVEHCADMKCPLYPLRFGIYPKEE
jgi:hypothetical protein